MDGAYQESARYHGMTPTDKFVQFVKDECKEHGVKLRFSPYKRVKAGGYVSGYFDDNPPVLVIAKKHPLWLGILAHEFCHLRQWVEKADVYTKTKISTGECAWTVQNRQLAGEKIPEEHLDEAYRIIIRCERDCDLRAMDYIRKFKLPIDLKEYARQANAYHFFYHAVKARGKWYGKVPIYLNKKVIKLSPNHMRTDPENGCPPKLLEALIEHVDGNHGIVY